MALITIAIWAFQHYGPSSTRQSADVGPPRPSPETLINPLTGDPRTSRSLLDLYSTGAMISIAKVGKLVKETDLPFDLASLARAQSTPVQGYAYDLNGDGSSEYFMSDHDASGARWFVVNLFVLHEGCWILTRKEVWNPHVIPTSKDGHFFEVAPTVSHRELGGRVRYRSVVTPYRLSNGAVSRVPFDTLESYFAFPGDQWPVDRDSIAKNYTWTGEQVDDLTDSHILSVTIADANNDRQADILVTTHDGLVLMYEYQGARWGRSTITSVSGYRATFVRAVGDADNDGRNEVLVDVRDEPVYANNSAELRLYRYVNGYWQYQTITEKQAGSYEAAIGDADGDGDNDIVVTGYNLGRILLFTSVGDSFAQLEIDAVPQSGWPTSSIPSIGDAWNKGMPQVYVGTHTSGNIYAYRWDGYRWLVSAVEVNTGNVALPYADGLDCNGSRMLLVSKYGGSWGLKIYRYTGSSWLGTVVESEDRTSVDIADIDGDGSPEILSAFGSTIYAYSCQPNGTWARRTLISDIEFAVSSFHTGDATNEGRPSIVAGQRDGGKVWLYKRRAD